MFSLRHLVPFLLLGAVVTAAPPGSGKLPLSPAFTIHENAGPGVVRLRTVSPVGGIGASVSRRSNRASTAAATVHPVPQEAETYRLFVNRLLDWLQYLAVVATGFGIGLGGWLLTGHQATWCLLAQMPMAWTLRRRQVLTSALPFLKYVTGGLLLLASGGILVHYLWGVWTQPFDYGLLFGVALGLVNSLRNPPGDGAGSQVDFLLANERHVDKSQVTIFSDDG